MRSRRSPLLWVAAIAYGATIFALSSLPVPVPGEQALPLTGDKVLHVAEYAGFALLLALAIASTPSARLSGRAAPVAFVAAALYAASDEFHQTLVPGRQGDLADLVADGIGVLLGTAIVQVWRWRASRSAGGSEAPPRSPDGPL